MRNAPGGHWTFEELTSHCIVPETSLAYWFCLLKRDLPLEWRSAKLLYQRMSYHYDVEDQASYVRSFRSEPELIPKYFVPLAPVTVTDRWSPFPLISELAGPAEYGEKYQDGPRQSPSVFAAFRLPAAPLQPLSRESGADAVHCYNLLKHAVRRATRTARRLLLVASPGWSYADARYNKVPDNVAQLMVRFGYVTTRRAPR